MMPSVMMLTGHKRHAETVKERVTQQFSARGSAETKRCFREKRVTRFSSPHLRETRRAVRKLFRATGLRPVPAQHGNVKMEEMENVSLKSGKL